MRLFPVTALTLLLGTSAVIGAEPATEGIPHRHVADMLFELAFANRTAYTKDVVQRLSMEESVISASEQFKEEKGLPLPAQMFRLSAEELLGNTDDFWLQLRSLSPINYANGPITPVEEQGLEFVAANPGERFYAEEKGLTGRRSLVAVYADVASVDACVSCHNNHPGSPRNDFKLGDVMGGIIIRIFLDE